MLVFLTLLNLIIPNAEAGSEIVIRSSALIQHGSPIVLGDLVESDQLPPDLLKTPLAAAPQPGETVEFSSAAISGLLHKLTQSKYRVRIPHRVVIERSTHKWERSVIERELVSFWQPLCVDCQLEIERLSLPLGQFENWTMKPKREIPRGAFSVPVEATRDGQSATVWLQGQLTIRKRVPIAKRAIFFGERIVSQDFAWELRDVTQAMDGVPSGEQINGRRLKSSLRIDDILFLGMLEHEKAILRGETARVISGQGDWEVSVSAIAQSDADIGDIVTLKSAKTNKDLVGKVIARGEVEAQ